MEETKKSVGGKGDFVSSIVQQEGVVCCKYGMTNMVQRRSAADMIVHKTCTDPKLFILMKVACCAIT